MPNIEDKRKMSNALLLRFHIFLKSFELKSSLVSHRLAALKDLRISSYLISMAALHASPSLLWLITRACMVFINASAGLSNRTSDDWLISENENILKQVQSRGGRLTRTVKQV